MEIPTSLTTVAGVLWEDTLAPYLFIFWLDYILLMLIDLIKENGFTLKKAKSRWYPAETMTDTDLCRQTDASYKYTCPSESLLYSLEQVSGSIGLYVNANKAEYMCFKQEGAIFTLGGTPLKLVDQCTYLASNMSSTESDVNLFLVKV